VLSHVQCMHCHLLGLEVIVEGLADRSLSAPLYNGGKFGKRYGDVIITSRILYGFYDGG
jgi:hypothetical protein